MHLGEQLNIREVEAQLFCAPSSSIHPLIEWFNDYPYQGKYKATGIQHAGGCIILRYETSGFVLPSKLDPESEFKRISEYEDIVRQRHSIPRNERLTYFRGKPVPVFLLPGGYDLDLPILTYQKVTDSEVIIDSFLPDFAGWKSVTDAKWLVGKMKREDFRHACVDFQVAFDHIWGDMEEGAVIRGVSRYAWILLSFERMTNQPESTFYRNLRSIKDGLPEPVQACLPFIDEYWERFVFGFPHEFTERKEGDIWAAMEKLSEILGKKVYDLVFPLSDELLRGRDFFFWQIQKFITHG